MKTITVTEPGLVILVGCIGSGKTTFANRLFAKHEIVSLDDYREVVSGSRRDLSATRDASAVASEIVERRLKRRLLTVVDATNVRSEDRRVWTEIAARTHSIVTAIVLDPGQTHCQRVAEARDGEHHSPKAVAQQHGTLARERRRLKHDGIRNIINLTDADEISSAMVIRRPTWNDLRTEHGPFDIIGDIHGMADELETLLAKLGWNISWANTGDEGRSPSLFHPDGRKLVFVGDACDRGPRSLDALLIMETAVRSGQGFAVASNHDERLKRWLNGRDVTINHGLDKTIAEFEDKSPAFRKRIADFIDSLQGHIVLDRGRLAVAHAGLREDMILGASKDVRQFAVFGPMGSPGRDGKPVRVDWADEYRGSTSIVYGHTVVDEPVWHNRTINIDTGAVFGGSLSALRWPEKEIVSVAASAAHATLDNPPFSRKKVDDPSLIGFSDVSGKKHVETSLMGRVTVDANHMSGALEHMTRHTIDPRWLVYIPPTMSPVESSSEGEYLEHPDQAFDYYRRQGISELVVEAKHMGSRALVLVCRDENTARDRFGATDGSIGHVWSRSGRAFFDEADRKSVLETISSSAGRSIFNTLETDWVLLDCEIMPWNAKATDLIEKQFAPTGKAASMSALHATDALRRFNDRGLEGLEDLSAHYWRRFENAFNFDQVWRNYCWDAPSVSDIRIAPFHVLASEGRVYQSARHVDHLAMIDMLVSAQEGAMLQGTDHMVVDIANEASLEAARAMWLDRTSKGAEGIVVKPHAFSVSKGERSLVQPALKVRGRDYLRIIYGPDYDLPENLSRLRERAIGSKRQRALSQSALGIEALERLVRREPIRRVHECVFASIALDSDPLDPRL
ncbi:polynucleotide kinase-phosphatase [Agrobacterium rubi]|nr:polynucleotide kinase-phosphatase [Agrobacterium rubi]NTF24811.1 polynucleotide kinase-phosphatase [Agrobacterium rubi]